MSSTPPSPLCWWRSCVHSLYLQYLKQEEWKQCRCSIGECFRSFICTSSQMIWIRHAFLTGESLDSDGEKDGVHAHCDHELSLHPVIFLLQEGARSHLFSSSIIRQKIWGGTLIPLRSSLEDKCYKHFKKFARSSAAHCYNQYTSGSVYMNTEIRICWWNTAISQLLA